MSLSTIDQRREDRRTQFEKRLRAEAAHLGRRAGRSQKDRAALTEVEDRLCAYMGHLLDPELDGL